MAGHVLRDCVWELTLRCNARCVHCGSDAGAPRADELSTDEALQVCDDLGALECEVVTFSGGEPLLRDDWERLARRLIARGAKVELISNGLLIDERMAARCAAAGLSSVSMSVDGDEGIHDGLRGVPGGFRKVLDAARCLRRAGVRVGAVTQVCRPNLHALPRIEDALVEAGFEGWQIQLTNPVGRAEGRALAVAPADVPAVVEFIRGTPKIPRYAADDIGWMSPDEPEIRSSKRPCDTVYCGCSAGLALIGLTADGTVRGCLSMPKEFDEGNVRARPLAEIWKDPGAFAYNRRFSEASLTGACRECAFRRICRAGCKTLAWSTQRSLSENRYCLRLQEPR